MYGPSQPPTGTTAAPTLRAAPPSPSDDHGTINNPPPKTYCGPTLHIAPDAVESPIISAVQLAEVGLDLAVAPSVVSPGQYGLYVRCSEGVESTTLPECTLLCGYARDGSFEERDVGDKTVGFALPSGTTAVFFERELMTVGNALAKAAKERGNGSCGLVGHELELEGDELLIRPMSSGEGRVFAKYFVPNLVNSESGGVGRPLEEMGVQNYGQFCNDLAWNYDAPPANRDEYDALSDEKNAVQLVWRLEYDAQSKCLAPSWPVSVLSRDWVFENADFLELGTKYGWGYWQASVEVEG